EAWFAYHDDLVQNHLYPNLTARGLKNYQVVDPATGRILAATSPSYEGTFSEPEGILLEGLVGTYIGRVENTESEEGPVMHVSTPIRANDWTTVGVLVAEVNLDEMGRILRLSSGAHDSEVTYVINDLSYFVTEPRFGEANALLRAVHSDGAEASLLGESGVAIYKDYRDIRVIGSYRWIEHLGLGLLVEIDWAEVMAPIVSLRRTMIAIGLGVALAVLGVSASLSRSIIRPIRSLTRGTEEVGTGNLQYRIPTKGGDELSRLGSSFNQMAESLRHVTASRDDLEREVAARTDAEMELKSTIDALRQSEEKFRLLTDSSPIGVFIFKDMVLKYVNPMFAGIFGYSTDEIVDRLGPMDITHPEDHQIAADYIGQCYADIKGLPPCSFVGVRKDGDHIHCEALGTPIDYEGGVAILGTMVDVTERVRTHEDLRLKNTVFESSIAANSTADVNGIITHANASFVRNWGYDSEEDVTGLPISRLHAHEDEAIAKATALDRTGEWEGDFVALRKNGSTFVSSGHATVLRNEAGDLIGYQSTNIDVTKQRRAEADIRQAKEITDSIINSLPGVFYQISSEGRFIRWNATFETVTGYSGDEIAQMSPLDFFEDAEKEQVAQSIERVFTEGQADVTAGFRMKNKSTIPFYFTGMLKLLGGIPYLIGVGTDITSLLDAEAAVRESEEKFRTMVETIAEWMWEVDGNVAYSYASPRVTDLLGYRPSEVIGKTPFAFMPPDEAERVRDVLREAVDAREPFAGVENINIHKDGHRVVLETSGRPIHSQTGELLGYRGIARDISDRKAAEEKLNHLLAELQRSNKELEQFAYIASHDLQEPLRMVASYTQLLERRFKDALDEDAQEFIAYAVGGANRMQRLINDLLAFSRVQTRGQPFEHVDLNEVLERAQKNLRAAIDESEATVTHDTLPIVPADHGQLVSVFQNLLSNAVKFRSDKAPRIHIGVKELESLWEFSVADNGIGINSDFFDRIFVIFQRLHTRDEYPGTGIGLALCKRIVERHGGTIWVTSAESGGTTFCFTMSKVNKEAE
ncbi:PAS domain S-box protein, partial [Candidatus Bipolaricaulota bacterium]